MTLRALTSDYEELLFARCLDEKICALSKQGRARLYTPFRGQEAAQVALGRALNAQDWLLPTFRDSAAMVRHGVPLEALLSFWMGYEEAHLAFGVTWPVCAPVATQLPHAVGLALAEQTRQTAKDRTQERRAVAVCLGDGAMSKGDAHEAMNLASTWSLPVLFFCQNNAWAISTPLKKQSAVSSFVARAESYDLWAQRVDGDDLEATERVVKEALERIRRGEGPAFIEATTWREGGHSVIDQPQLYRDPQSSGAPPLTAIERLESQLRRAGVDVDKLQKELSRRFEASLNEAVKKAERACEGYRAHRSVSFEHVYDELPPELIDQRALAQHSMSTPVHRSPLERRSRQPRAAHRPTILFSTRKARGREGQRLNMSEAINLALHEALEADASVMVLGQDVATLGGVFRVTKGLLERFGEGRVIDTPISESGVMGACVGLAVGGYRPIYEVQFAGFVYSAYEQLRSHLARLRQRTRGAQSAPVLIRMPVGGGVGAPESHCESVEALFASTPGLKVVTPSGPRSARALLRAAINDPDPVIFLEPTALYFSHKEWVPDEPEVLPVGFSLLRRRGHDLTAVSYGASLTRLLKVAERLKKEGRSLEIIELATLSPLDVAPIKRSLKKTKRLVVFHEGPRYGDVSAELLARLTEEGVHLERFERITGWDIPYPYPSHETSYLTSDEQLYTRLSALCKP